MKRMYATTNGFATVLFVDDDNNAYVVGEKSFDEVLTPEVARDADYSNLDNCKTAQECYDAMSFGDVIKFDPEEFEEVIEF